ncbi:uncharacterized protein [Hemitrygon akajei]|uniref:uncharacterized protein isoform X2 n=1 Tax=Hemitrygon akajei TaxID=2704970 RepID=UPI003BF98D18
MENQCNVQCYGRGNVHQKIVKELHISPREEPGVPCVLFVYKVSHEIQDLRNALQWVTEKQGVRREDIGVVILLEKCWDKVYKPVEVAHQGMFDANTVVVRILWEQLRWNSPVKIQESLSNKEAMDKVKRSISKCQVQCYGRGDVHEKSVKDLDISSCESPEIPCVLFVYKVSREIEDLRNSLQWVTEKQGMKRRNICAVILLEKCLRKWKMPVEVDHQGTFDTNTVVVRILWDSPEQIHEAMDKVKQSIRRWWGDNWTVIHTAETLDNLYKPVDVAYQAMLNPKTVVVRMFWDSLEKIQEQPCYKEAVDKVKQSIRTWQDYSKDTSAFTTQ